MKLKHDITNLRMVEFGKNYLPRKKIEKRKKNGTGKDL